MIMIITQWRDLGRRFAPSFILLSSNGDWVLGWRFGPFTNTEVSTAWIACRTCTWDHVEVVAAVSAGSSTRLAGGVMLWDRLCGSKSSKTLSWWWRRFQQVSLRGKRGGGHGLRRIYGNRRCTPAVLSRPVNRRAPVVLGFIVSWRWRRFHRVGRLGGVYYGTTYASLSSPGQNPG